ncbi:MAG: ferredoxin reductase family protein [Candidatus Magasanikbacteria bacterium]
MKKSLLPLFIIFNLLIIFYFWFVGSGDLILSGNTEQILLSLGRLSGLLAVFFVLLQLILIGRLSWVECVFGMDKLSRLHHWNGIIAFGFIITHPILLGLSYARFNEVSFFQQLVDFTFRWEEVGGAVLGTLLFAVIVISSMVAGLRKVKYEFWFWVHFTVYLAILLVFEHEIEVGGDFVGQPLFVAYWYALYAFAIGNLVLFRFVRPAYYFYTHRFYVDKVVRETASTVSIYIKGRKMDQFKIEAGQFMIFRFLDAKRWWQAHPFSLSCAPNDEYLRITVKNVGDFTSEISGVKVGTPVLVDGPHGIFTKKVARSNKLLFVAGGVGITPIRSLVEQMAQEKRELTLVYSNKYSSDIVFFSELELLAEQYHFELYHVLSDDHAWQGLKGRIHIDMLKQLVNDVDERDVYVCGPPAMMESVINILQKMFVSKQRIHFEKFSL